jgi:ornithine cyclodeaminase
MKKEIALYSAEDVHAALPFARLADALADAFSAGCEAPVRHAHQLSPEDTLLLMPAWRNSGDSSGALGIKVVTVMPGAVWKGASTVSAIYLLLDRDTGKPRAILDGEALTFRRTAAASALAARYLARPDSQTLLLVGTGGLAPWMAQAYAELNPSIKRILIWGRSIDKAESVARKLMLRIAAERAMEIIAVPDVEEAVMQSDVISCATTSKTPIIHGAWVKPGTHIDLVGGFRPDMREADDEAVFRSRLFVDTRAGALSEAGDILGPVSTGVIGLNHVKGELADLVRGTRTGRKDPLDITMFKSVGTALEDLAAAETVLRSS